MTLFEPTATREVAMDELLPLVSRLVGPDSVLPSPSSAWRYNVAQWDYAKQVCKLILRHPTGQAALGSLQAATGTGKTMGYLAPLMAYSALTGHRVAVSTHSRFLQQQMINDSATLNDALSKVLPDSEPLKVAVRYGRQNYLSLTACQRLLAGMGEKADSSDGDQLRQIIAWLSSEDRQPRYTGLFTDYLTDHGIQGLSGKLTVQQIALDSGSPEHEQVAYYRHVLDAHLADVVIINHHLLISNEMYRGELLNEVRPINALVVDEADKLRNATESMANADLPLHRLVGQVEVAAETGLMDVTEASEKLLKTISQLAPSDNVMILHEASDRSDSAKAALTTYHDTLIKALKKAKAKENLDGLSILQSGLMQELSFAADLISQVIKSNEHSMGIITWSPVRAFPSIRLGHKHPARILSRLWNTPSPDKVAPPTAILFTSATLTAGTQTDVRGFDDFYNQLGIIRHPRSGETAPIHAVQSDIHGVYEPSSFGQCSFVLADPSMPLPTLKNDEHDPSTNPLWLDYCAKVVRAASANDERALTLTLSFRDTYEIADRLMDAGYADRLIVHRAGQRMHTLIEAYKAMPNAILLSPSAWEGVNLPNLVPNTVITRIPYGKPDSSANIMARLVMERQNLSPEQITGVLMRRMLIDAAKKLHQGLGRGIRQRTDKTTYWIADPRFPLPSTLRNSLDPVFLSAQRRHVNSDLLHAIPQRFRMTSFEDGEVLLVDGEKYTRYRPVI